MGIKNVPLDIWFNIAEYLDAFQISYLISVLNKIYPKNTSQLQQIKDSRLSYTKKLKELVPDVKSLVSIMEETGTILIGQKALEYFIPETYEKKGVWKFCCNKKSDVYTDLKYATKFIESLQDIVNLTIQEIQFDTAIYSKLVKAYIESGSDKREYIEVIVPYSDSVLDSVLNLDCSLLSCFISHVGAVHLYPNLSFNRRNISFNITVKELDICTANDGSLYSLSDTDKSCKLHEYIRYNYDDELETIILPLVARQCGKYEKMDKDNAYEGIFIKLRGARDIRNSSNETITDIVDLCHKIIKKDCTCDSGFSNSTMEHYKRKGYTEMSFMEHVSNTRHWVAEPDHAYMIGLVNINQFQNFRSLSISDGRVFKVLNCYRSQLNLINRFSWIEFRGGIMPLHFMHSKYRDVESGYSTFETVVGTKGFTAYSL